MQVYSVVLHSAQSVNSEMHIRLLAESLHQHWLSDANFGPAAARLAFQVLRLIYNTLP